MCVLCVALAPPRSRIRVTISSDARVCRPAKAIKSTAPELVGVFVLLHTAELLLSTIDLLGFCATRQDSLRNPAQAAVVDDARGRSTEIKPEN